MTNFRIKSLCWGVIGKGAERAWKLFTYYWKVEGKNQVFRAIIDWKSLTRKWKKIGSKEFRFRRRKGRRDHERFLLLKAKEKDQT